VSHEAGWGGKSNLKRKLGLCPAPLVIQHIEVASPADRKKIDAVCCVWKLNRGVMACQGKSHFFIHIPVASQNVLKF
jgi:hypothetical protein